MTDISETIATILNAHTRGFRDIPSTARLLYEAHQQASTEEQTQLFQLLRSHFLSTPLFPPKQTGSIISNTHSVIIKAFAEFGPTAQLPKMVLSKLNTDNAEQIELWVQNIYQPFQYSLFHNADRFPKPVLQEIQAQYAPAIFQHNSGIAPAGNYPDTLMRAITDIGAIVDRIEFDRFAKALQEVMPKPTTQPENLRGHLSQLGFDAAIAQAIENANTYVQGTGPFTEKIAGDLLRAAIDTTHRAIVAKLEVLTKQPYSGQDKDGERRAYMAHTKFITPTEEKFFSAVYTLLSGTASHQLNAPRETMLVIETTINAYIMLLIRRISDRTITTTK